MCYIYVSNIQQYYSMYTSMVYTMYIHIPNHIRLARAHTLSICNIPQSHMYA